MTLIPELRAELAATLERRARRRRRRLFGLTPVALVATGGIALAASGVLRGPDTPARLGLGKSDADSGVVVGGTDRLLAVRAADPDGGALWTLRLTRRGKAACLTPERVGGAKRLARDSDCAPMDAGGRLFFNVGSTVLVDDACAAAPAGCTTLTQRTVLFGALGPGAKSVTYTTPTGAKNVPTTGPEGAYLIVLPQRGGAFGTSRYPSDEAIKAISLRDGRECTRPRFDATACPLPGFRQPQLKLPTRDEVGAHVTATARQGRRFWVMRIRFRARVAADGIASAYTVRIIPPHSPTGRSSRGPVRGIVNPGQQVEHVVQHLNGGGEYRIIVTYNRVTEPGQLPMGNVNAVTVGRFRLRIP